LWCIHNAMEFEKRGVFTTTICTSGFASLLKRTSEAKGFPNLAIVKVSHPIGGIELSKVREKADGAISDIIKILTEPSEKLPEAIGQ
jgi:hypothetical protein